MQEGHSKNRTKVKTYETNIMNRTKIEIYEAKIKNRTKVEIYKEILRNVSAKFDGAEKFINAKIEKICSHKHLSAKEVIYFVSESLWFVVLFLCFFMFCCYISDRIKKKLLAMK